MSAPARIRTPLAQHLADATRGPLALVSWLAIAGLCVWLLDRRVARSETPGIARALEYPVSSLVAGRVERLLVEFLEQVEAGQAIAVLEDGAVEARLDTLTMRIGRLRAELDAERERLEARAREQEEGRRVDQRRFANDEETLRLEALELALEIESDLVQRQRHELTLTRLGRLEEQGIATQGELDEARLDRERTDVRLRLNRERLTKLQETQTLALQRSEEFLTGEPTSAASEPLLRPLRERIREEELALRELEVARQGLVLRAPAAAIVQHIDVAPGQVLEAGQRVALLVSPVVAEVLAYLPEQEELVLDAGTRARVSTLRSPLRSSDFVVVRVGRALELLPTRLWRNAARPEYGLPVLVRGVETPDLLPGERVSVRFD